MTQAIQFQFTTEDCIAMRKQVMQFYRSLVGQQSGILNLVNDEQPAEDVMADIQMICYIYLAMLANQEMQDAAEVVMPNGNRAMNGEARKIYGYYRKDWADFYRRIPMNDTRFVCNYADIDEAIEDNLRTLVKQTYYPVLNEILKKNSHLPSPVCHATAHAITALAYLVYGLERGMKDNHCIHSPLLHRITERVGKISAFIPCQNGNDMRISSEMLEGLLTQVKDAITNAFQPVMNAVAERCEELDLTAYINSADMPLSEYYAKQKQIGKANASVIANTKSRRISISNQKILNL